MLKRLRKEKLQEEVSLEGQRKDRLSIEVLIDRRQHLVVHIKQPEDLRDQVVVACVLQEHHQGVVRTLELQRGLQVQDRLCRLGHRALDLHL